MGLWLLLVAASVTSPVPAGSLIAAWQRTPTALSTILDGGNLRQAENIASIKLTWLTQQSPTAHHHLKTLANAGTQSGWLLPRCRIGMSLHDSHLPALSIDAFLP
jgi:hypothetical protein